MTFSDTNIDEIRNKVSELNSSLASVEFKLPLGTDLDAFGGHAAIPDGEVTQQYHSSCIKTKTSELKALKT